MRKFLAFFCLVICTTSLYAQNPFGQNLQINTRFNSIVGKPTWLLIIRDVNTGLVSPYMFDIRDNENFWIAFTYGHSYQITASTLKFGPFAVIHNFCRLESGILTRQSMIINLRGNLTPYRGSSKCHIMKYNGSHFPIVGPNSN